MQRQPDTHRVIQVEVEIPPLAMLAQRAGDRSTRQSPDCGVTLSDLGEMRSAGDVWAVAPSGAMPASARECTDASAGVVRLCCELPVPEPGQSRVYRLSVHKAHTATDGSGHAWNSTLHATEEELIAIQATVGDAAQASEAPPGWSVPGRAGRSRCIPGVRVLYVALSPDGDVTRAWVEDAGGDLLSA